MKIGILTYHRAVNDGSILQAYCLHQMLRSRFPDARVEIVDYRSRNIEQLERKRLLRRRPPFYNRSYLQTRRELRRFLEEKMSLSPRSCTTNDLEEARRFVQAQEYDAIFVGSDTVWEIREQDADASRTVTWNAPRVPNIYFLAGVEGVKKIAFAVSADPVEPVDRLMNDGPRIRRFLEAVDDFDLVFFRDDTTRALLERVGVDGGRLDYMPDPAVLWNFDSIVDVPGDVPDEGKPVAGVGVPVVRLQKELTGVLEKMGYTVVHLLRPGVEGRWNVPSSYRFGERLGVHGKLDLIVTDRFHRSILTMKLSRSPVLFIEHGKWLEPNSKGRDLLSRLGYGPMVWRYDGGGVPEGLIEEYLRKWRELGPNVKEDMETLRRRGDAGLDRIAKLLTTP